MPLRETLSALVRSVDGALAAVVMAHDGIPIDESAVPGTPYDLQALAVEYAALLKDIRHAAEVLKIGHLEEVSITTTQVSVILRSLNEELFCVMILAREGNIGLARYQLRLRSNDMTRELS